METLNLTAPVSQPSVTTYTVERIFINRTPASIAITMKDSNGVTTTITYNVAAGASLLTTLNTSNFSVNSLQKQTLNKLKADGFLPAGTVSGTPD